MSAKIFKEFRDLWSAYRAPSDASYLVDKWPNLRQSLKGSGSVSLPGGVTVDFNPNNKRQRFGLLIFGLTEGVMFTKGEGVSQHRWLIDREGCTFTTPQGISFLLDSFNELIFGETYLHDIHFVDFDGDGRLVVDAGGFVGDTSLYYASKGFKVVSLEPDVQSFEWLKKNISLNPSLSPSIIPLNCAMGHDGEVLFAMTNTGGSSVFRSDNRRKIKSLSIKSILESYADFVPYLLHLDVKGVEFELIKQPEVALFKRVRLEYCARADGTHLGTPQLLVERLTGYGFRHIRIFKHNYGPYPLEWHGTIDALK